jgi:hypothetical protein
MPHGIPAGERPKSDSSMGEFLTRPRMGNSATPAEPQIDE